MLKFKDDEKNLEFFKQHKIEGHHFRNVLLPLMRNGEWEKIKDFNVLNLLNGESIRFGDDTWKTSGLDVEAYNLVFTYHGKKLSNRLTNELKAYALAKIFTGTKTVNLSAIVDNLKKLRKVALCMMKAGVNSFSELTDAKYKDIAQANPNYFDDPMVTRSINGLIDYHDALPFDIQFTYQSQKKVKLKAKSQEQHLVMPPRIYTAMLRQFSADVTAILPHLQQLESEINRLFDIKTRFKTYIFEQLRLGKVTNPFDSRRILEKVFTHFELAGVTLVDYLKGEEESPGRWMETMNSLEPSLKGINAYSEFQIWQFEAFQVGQRRCEKIGEFSTFLVELDFKCKTLCLLLSGMRIDELHSMHPKYGAQSYDYNGQTIDLFTTRQSKITRGIQTEEDMFVTNQTGHDAFRVLTTIHRPYLSRIADAKGRYFASIRATDWPFTRTKANWGGDLITNVNKWIDQNIGSSMTNDDVSFLRISNPSNTGIEVGATFHYENHQTRRSFAFYTIGLELMAFPQLKKQLSHLSSGMTRHYANNATYWGRLRSEINEERVLQKSTLLANVYKRLAENGTIAGGKGKILKKLAGNKNFFELGLQDRRLDPGYWAKLIEAGKEHIHAIAPGMYCTNTQCDMRINVALDECVDCEFDLIMDGLYAEGKRLAAHRNLVVLDEMNDLNPSVVSQLIVQIKSCEKILSDLEIPFTAITIPKHVNNMIIDTVTI
ncbi:MAG: hypothetical protein ACRCVP_12805 [Shewanella xiamenensis]